MNKKTQKKEINFYLSFNQFCKLYHMFPSEVLFLLK
jgi:hypothetical protein